MKEYYVIEDIANGGFWDNHYREFRGYLYTRKHESEEEALNFAKKEVRGVFKITKIYDIK
jgi:hypothetical protein